MFLDPTKNQVVAETLGREAVSMLRVWQHLEPKRPDRGDYWIGGQDELERWIVAFSVEAAHYGNAALNTASVRGQSDDPGLSDAQTTDSTQA